MTVTLRLEIYASEVEPDGVTHLLLPGGPDPKNGQVGKSFPIALPHVMPRLRRVLGWPMLATHVAAASWPLFPASDE